MGNFKDWLNRAKAKISGFFKNVWKKVTDWWEEGVDWISENVPQLIEVAEVLKNFLKGRLDNVFIVDVIGIRGYEKAEKIIIRGLERSITYLGHVDDVNECLEKPDNAEKIQCLAEKLKKLTNAGEEGTAAFNFVKEALIDILEQKGVTVDDVKNKKVETIVQAFYDAKTLEK